MNQEDARRLVREKLSEIAPETTELPIDWDATYRDQFDLDSMDFLNLIAALQAITGLDFPESDYPRLSTPAGCVDYIAQGLNNRLA